MFSIGDVSTMACPIARCPDRGMTMGADDSEILLARYQRGFVVELQNLRRSRLTRGYIISDQFELASVSCGSVRGNEPSSRI